MEGRLVTPKRTLILIAAFVAFMLGSFIWYIATWDAEKRAPTSQIQTTLSPTGATS